MISFALAAACIGLCFFASLKDIQSLTIPNWVNGSIALTGLLALPFAGIGLEAAAWHVGAAAITLIICMALFFAGVFGGGDAKMIPAAVLWVGPAGLLPFLMATVLAGGVLALVLLQLRPIALANFPPAEKIASLQTGAGAPYGVAITAGLIWAIPATPTLSALLG